MTVFDNMAFGLKLRKVPKAEIATRVRQAASTLGLEPVLDRKPKALSGGQRQRVALGRAIVREPAVFLFDEPLSNLDAKLRVQTRTEIAALHRQLRATMIYVTHDQVEAMTMGDRIVVLDRGRVQQVAPPLELYNRPANRFVAGFIGSPAMNFVEGALDSDGTFVADGGAFRVERAAPGGPSGPVTLGVRPEGLFVAGRVPPTKRTAGSVIATVKNIEPMGNEIVMYVTIPDGPSLVARVEPQPLPEPGETVELAVDLDGLHLFDPATGESLVADAAPASV